MDGTLDIRKLSNLGSTVEVYQVRYEDLVGESFVASMNRQELHDLMYHKLPLGLSNQELDQSFDRVVQEGHITLDDIHLRGNEAVGAGLTYMQVEG